MFAGIDPGTTVGYCVLDINGKIVKLGSKKELSSDRLVKLLSEAGKILVVSSDKRKTPSFVKTVGVKLGAYVYAPKEDVPVSEKIIITKGISKNIKNNHIESGEKYKYKNSHERDAIASAILSYQAHAGKIKEVKDFLDKNNTNHDDLADFLNLSLKNPKINYQEILIMIRNKNAEINTTSKAKEKKETKTAKSTEAANCNNNGNKNILKSMLKHNNALLKENTHLRKENKILLEKINKLSKRLPYPNDSRSQSQSFQKQKPDKDLMKLLVLREKRYHGLVEELKKIRNEKTELQASLNKILSYASHTDKYVFVDYLDDLKQIRSNILTKANLDKVDTMIFVRNINEFSTKSWNAVNKSNVILISPSKISSKLKDEKKAIFVEWKDLFYKPILDKVVLKLHDLDKMLSSRKAEDILEEYKQQRKQELNN